METALTKETLIAALEAGKQLADTKGRTVDLLNLPHVLLPTGMSLQLLTETVKLADQREERDKPRRLKGTATLGDEASFIEHINRFKDASSVIFQGETALLAVFNYNSAAAGVDDRNTCARFGDHRADFVPKVSDEWKAWVDGQKKPLGQEAFADFIDEHLADIAPSTDDRKVPSAGDLATMALQLKASSDDTLESSLNRTTGETSVVFKKELKVQGNTVIPPEFDIQIPIFTGGPLQRITCKLRFRKGDEGALFFWAVPGATQIKVKAQLAIGERVKAATSLPVLSGKPE